MCQKSNETKFVSQELATLRKWDCVESKAAFSLYLLCKFRLASFNTCGSTIICTGACFGYASRKWKREKYRTCYVIEFCVKLEENSVEPCKKIKNAFGDDSSFLVQIFRFSAICFRGEAEEEDKIEAPPFPCLCINFWSFNYILYF